MTDHAARTRLATHEVENQPDIPARDLWASDPALRDWAAGADTGALAAFGAEAGQARWRDAGRAANRHPPDLRLFDRGGRRLDEVTFHPAYHDLMQLGLSHGYAAVAWDGGRHATHAGLVYALSQIEPGVCCPMTMTYAAVPALAADPALAAEWVPKLTTRAYDGSSLPLAAKHAATLGMAMTEKQGGSDVRANSTRAEATAE